MLKVFRLKTILLFPIFIGLIAILGSCGEAVNTKNSSTVTLAKDACNFLITALESENQTLQNQDSNWKSRSKHVASEDPAYAEALSEYPQLNQSILLRDNWDRHALRMINLYQHSAKLARTDPELAKVLKDNAYIWKKRLKVYQTAPGNLKAKLVKEQLALDVREGITNRNILRFTCKIPEKLLP